MPWSGSRLSGDQQDVTAMALADRSGGRPGQVADAVGVDASIAKKDAQRGEPGVDALNEGGQGVVVLLTASDLQAGVVK